MNILKKSLFSDLNKIFKGQLHTNLKWRLLYATDASVYREIPIAVAFPTCKNDIKILIDFALKHKIPLIPRTAGTSLAGQVVGNGIVVDVSKYMNSIIDFDANKKTVKVEPGVVLDELNIKLKSSGLFFAPETSTSNRCMLGGMIGNNSCGSHSLLYGSTRDHIISIEALLSDGSEVVFKSIDSDEFHEKCLLNNLEGKIYRHIKEILSDKSLAEEIIKEYPHHNLKRRNSGYALDLLLNTNVFGNSNKKLNFCNLIAGSEGTLAFITSATLNLLPLAPKHNILLCAHFEKLEEVFEANLIMLEHKPAAIELMDNVIIECAKSSIEHTKNSFFISGSPQVIAIIEFAKDSLQEAMLASEKLTENLKSKNLGYHFSIVKGDDIKKVWDLRKAGLGLLSNVKGDAKPVSVIEDTAVLPEFLLNYIKDFKILLTKLNLSSVYYGHIGTGELHLKPVLNLKKKEDRKLFKEIAFETAKLVKKYKGSLSGEHGDGRLRGEFLPLMYGENIYNKFCELKKIWDPNGIFNPGKITANQAINTSFRYKENQKEKRIKTFLNFSEDEGILRAVEKCNGSADCRKTHIIGGTMCPSYMATLDETSTTRARANILREFLTNSYKRNPFNYEEIYEIMELCLSCKGCKSECPSNIDMTKFKTEFLYNWYKANGIPYSVKIISSISTLNKIGSHFPKAYNNLITNKLFSYIIKKSLGFSLKRDIPLLYKTTFTTWYKTHNNQLITQGKSIKTICLFIDEFSEYNDVEIAIKTVKLLHILGYKVIIKNNYESGRAALSKGVLKKARKLANSNIKIYKDIINNDIPLLGIEPSAILSFRDEYPNLVKPHKKQIATFLAKNTFMVEEFITNEFKKGNIKQDLFTKDSAYIRLHGHCHQKAIVSTEPMKEMLEIPVNYTVNEIKSGCCGMAGSFGYEDKHYNLSMKIGELVLFPEIRKEPETSIIAASGTSCRQQIKDGTGRIAYHPIEILYNALKIK